MRNIKQGKGLAITGRWEEEQLQIGWGALTEVTFLRLEKTREWARLPSAGGIFQAEGRASARPRGKPCVWCIWGPACLLMARAIFPPWQLFGLRHPCTGAYRWLGRAGSLGCGEGIMASRRAQTNAPVPAVRQSQPCPCRSPSDTHRWVWPCLLWAHCFFPPGSSCA